jgi:hypothetical protein
VRYYRAVLPLPHGSTTVESSPWLSSPGSLLHFLIIWKKVSSIPWRKFFTCYFFHLNFFLFFNYQTFSSTRHRTRLWNSYNRGICCSWFHSQHRRIAGNSWPFSSWSRWSSSSAFLCFFTFRVPFHCYVESGLHDELFRWLQWKNV